MGSLLTSLRLSAETLSVLERSMMVTQNNVANANTPGYAKLTQTFNNLPFDPAGGLPGGVEAGPVLSARSQYLEQSVWRQQELLGQWSQKFEDLSQVEGQFDLTIDSGIPRALNAFFNGFSQLSVTPNSTVARQTVIELGRDVASSFQTAALSFNAAGQSADRHARDVVASINEIAGRIATLNTRLRESAGGGENAGIDAQLHAALEELAELSDFTALRQADGTFSVYLGGQTALVIGDHRWAVSADFSGPQTAIRDAEGKDISRQISGGRLASLLETRNVTLPGYLAELNQLAESLANAVNTALAGGLDRNGQPPAIDLFTYDAAAGAAVTLRVTAISPDDIAAAALGAPGGNGNAIALSQLARQPLAGGYTLTEAFGILAARVGRDLNAARENMSIQVDLVNQARVLRQEATGVSLDEEAAYLLQMQRSYQAAAKMVGVLDEMTETLVNLIR